MTKYLIISDGYNRKNWNLFKKENSAAGNRTPVSRVTGGDTNHYTTADGTVLPYASLHENPSQINPPNCVNIWHVRVHNNIVSWVDFTTRYHFVSTFKINIFSFITIYYLSSMSAIVWLLDTCEFTENIVFFIIEHQQI